MIPIQHQILTVNQSPYDNQHIILTSNPSKGDLDISNVPIDRKEDEESQSVLVEYLDQPSHLQQCLIFEK